MLDLLHPHPSVIQTASPCHPSTFHMLEVVISLWRVVSHQFKQPFVRHYVSDRYNRAASMFSRYCLLIQGLRVTSLPQKSPSVGHYRLRQPRRAEAPNRREVEGAATSLTLLSLLPSIRHPQSFLPYNGVLACLLNASFVFSTSRRI